MTSIAGVRWFEEAPDQELLARMARCMSRRDDETLTSQWHEGFAAVECARSVIASPPRVDGTTSNLSLVFDGRIDNARDVARSLHEPSNGSHTHDCVLRAFERWGPDCLHHLDGDFAFAIWDARSRQLFCAVDRMGARQLYYSHRAGFFGFASTEEALLEIPGAVLAPDDNLIAQLFVPWLRLDDRPRSWLDGIAVLGPGQWMVVDAAGHSETRTYWSFSRPVGTPPRNIRDAQEEFESVFRDAVRRRLNGAGIGQMVSGGLDSAAVLGAVRQAAPDDFRTYSFVSRHEGDPETACIRTMSDGSARHLDIDTGVSDADLLRECWGEAHPCDNSAILVMMLSRAARADGRQVLLHGASGDVVTMSPASYISECLRQGGWHRALSEAKLASVHHTYLRGTAPARLLAKNAWHAFVPAVARSWYRHTRVKHSGDAAFGTLLEADFARRLSLRERLAQQATADASPVRLRTDAIGQQIANLTGPFAPFGAAAGYGRIGRRFGIEMRDPWADRQVAEFFLRLPTEMKVHDGWTKFLVRLALDGRWPRDVVWRADKDHLGWHLTNRLMNASRDLVAENLAEHLSRVAPFVDNERIRKLSSEFLRGVAPFESTELLCRVLTLSFWLERLGKAGTVRVSSCN